MIADALKATVEAVDRAAQVVTVTTFKPGDLVRLRSGGPNMTVLETHSRMTSVAWFVGDVLHTENLESAALCLKDMLALPVRDTMKAVA